MAGGEKKHNNSYLQRAGTAESGSGVGILKVESEVKEEGKT